MNYLLDTNVVSELRKPPGRADPGVHAWARAQRTSDLWLSVITVMEVEIGVARIERRDERQGAELRRWVDRDLLPAFEGERGMTVATRNIADFASLGVELLDPGRPDADRSRNALPAHIEVYGGVHGPYQHRHR